MRYAVVVARILLGLPFTVFGLNTFLWSAFDRAFIQPPEEMPARVATFYEGIIASGFMNPLRGLVELAAGLMILSGFLTPLGLAMLAPVLVHIVLFHHFLEPQGLVLSYILFALELFLVYAYGHAFRALLDPRAKPRWAPPSQTVPVPRRPGAA